MEQQAQRLQKYLAQCGVASRRAAEELIAQGRVSVNGAVVSVPGTKVLPGDVVCVDGRTVQPQQRKVYLAFYKPPFVVCTLSDPQGRETVAQYFRDFPERLYPVGRLDYESEGLLFVTNDGEWANRMMHPRYAVEKEYYVAIRGELTPQMQFLLENGVLLEDGPTAPARLGNVRYDALQNRTTVTIAIHEGRNRQVRRMFAAVGTQVSYLKRVRIGTVQLGNLARGRYRALTEEERLALLQAGSAN